MNRRFNGCVSARILVLAILAFVLTMAGCGGKSSSPQAPSITTQPQSQTVLAGATATFSVTATGTATLAYQWSKGGTAISGATSPTYTTPATALSDSGGSFTVTVANSAGSATSSAATLTVRPKPAIAAFTAAPATVTAGSPVTLAFSFSGGTGTIDNSVGTVTSGTDVTVTPTAGTTYTLTVDNGYGTTATAAATVAVAPVPVAPAISAAATVTAARTGLIASVPAQSGMTYAWSIANGTITSGAATSAITFTPGAAGTPLVLGCTATNAAGASASGTASLAVVAAPAITGFTATPTSPLFGATASLTPTFTGGTGVVTPGIGTVTSGTAYATPALTSATTYTLTVTNAAGDSAPVQTLTVTPQTVTVAAVAPAGLVATVNESATFTSGVSGATSSLLTWSATGGTMNASTGAWVAPATAGTCTITATSAADPTRYASATVTVVAAPVATVTAPATAASGATGLLASVPSQTGSSYAWSISGGTLTTNDGTNQVRFTAGAVGTLTLTCTVTNGATTPQSATGSTTVNVVTAPVINSFTATPSSVAANGAVSLACAFTGGTGAISNDQDATVLAATSGGSVTVTPAVTTVYTLTVTPTAGSAVTQSATVTVATVPAFTTDLASTGTANTGATFTFTVAATSSVPVTTYTWYYNGTMVASTTAGTYTLSPVQSSDAGTWYAVAGNGLTTATSGTMTLTVLQAYAVSGSITLVDKGSAITGATVAISTTPVQYATTDSSGAFSFPSVTAGTYTLTPSLSGPESVFLPASRTLTVASDTTVAFQSALGYTVTGTLSYSGTGSSGVYIVLQNTSGGSPLGTHLPGSAPTGAFSIRGVPPGTYTLSATMDVTGSGEPNANDPSGTLGTTVTVSAADVTGLALAITDPSVSLTGVSGPSSMRVSPMDSGAVISYGAIEDSDGNDLATTYIVEWCADATFATLAGSQSFKANSDGVLILGFNSALVNGNAYYFRMRGRSGSTYSNYKTLASPVTIGARTGSYSIAGTVTFPSTPTGPLYVGVFDNSTGYVYAAAYQAPVTGQAYAVSGIPSGSKYFLFGILDQDNDGLIDAGDNTNTNTGNGSNTYSVTADLTGQAIALPTANATATLTTSHWQSDGASDSYGLNFKVRDGIKHVVSVNLVSGPNVVTVSDFGKDLSSQSFYAWRSLGAVRPAVGDTYSLLVQYSDATTETLTAQVTAVLDAFARNLAPSGAGDGSGTGTDIAPVFTWTAPATPPASFTYRFWIQPQNGSTIWQVPGSSSKLDGLSSSNLSLTWGTDPNDSSNTPTASLVVGTPYCWTLTVQDSSGNQAQNQVTYTP